MTQTSGKIIVCPTPIGNLGDITQRTVNALQSADIVCAEDTRVTKKLLSALGIQASLVRLDEAALRKRAADFIDQAAAGKTIAYCTDAGMPGVSDPGLQIVSLARKAGVHIDVLPGPSAAVTAYVASGTRCSCYYFGGFFPRKDAERRTLLEHLRPLHAALIFYESPKRLVSALTVIAATYPTRIVSVCRELTKLHEEVVRCLSTDIATHFAQREKTVGIKGEIVIVIDEPSLCEAEEAHSKYYTLAVQRASELAATQMRTKDITYELMDEFSLSRNEAYALATTAKKEH